MFVVSVIMIMIVIVPIPIRVPAVIVFTPPAVNVFPAIAAGLIEFFLILGGLRTVPAMVFGSLVKFTVGFLNAFLAIVVSARGCSARKAQRHGQSGGGNRLPYRQRTMVNFHWFSFSQNASQWMALLRMF
jgi:hypothetical protein